MKQYTEKAFETAIEYHLLANGYLKGEPATFDRSRALDPGEVIAFIKDTQPREWGYVEKQLGSLADSRIVDDLCAALNSSVEGCLKVLREGFKSYGKTFKIAYFAPARHSKSHTLPRQVI